MKRLDAAKRRRIRGIGLAGQMHGAVLLDEADRVLRPAILWNDGGTQPQCAELVRREPRTPDITGNPVLAGFTAPKLLWSAIGNPISSPGRGPRSSPRIVCGYG